MNKPSYIEGFMPLQPKKVDNAHGASKLYNLPGFLDSDKTMQLLLGAIVLYSSLPSLPQSTYNRRLAKNTSYLLCVTITILVTIICISVCNDLPKKSYLLTILITYQLFIIVTIQSLMVVSLRRQKHSFLEFIASYETPPRLDNAHQEESKDTEQSMHSDTIADFGSGRFPVCALSYPPPSCLSKIKPPFPKKGSV